MEMKISKTMFVDSIENIKNMVVDGMKISKTFN
jgi:hypothetical protein